MLMVFLNVHMVQHMVLLTGLCSCHQFIRLKMRSCIFFNELFAWFMSAFFLSLQCTVSFKLGYLCLTGVRAHTQYPFQPELLGPYQWSINHAILFSKIKYWPLSVNCSHMASLNIDIMWFSQYCLSLQVQLYFTINCLSWNSSETPQSSILAILSFIRAALTSYSWCNWLEHEVNIFVFFSTIGHCQFLF